MRKGLPFVLSLSRKPIWNPVVVIGMQTLLSEGHFNLWICWQHRLSYSRWLSFAVMNPPSPLLPMLVGMGTVGNTQIDSCIARKLEQTISMWLSILKFVIYNIKEQSSRRPVTWNLFATKRHIGWSRKCEGCVGGRNWREVTHVQNYRKKSNFNWAQKQLRQPFMKNCMNWVWEDPSLRYLCRGKKKCSLELD